MYVVGHVYYMNVYYLLCHVCKKSLQAYRYIVNPLTSGLPIFFRAVSQILRFQYIPIYMTICRRKPKEKDSLWALRILEVETINVNNCDTRIAFPIKINNFLNKEGSL